jgi:DNA-binding NtrC family response regulator
MVVRGRTTIGATSCSDEPGTEEPDIEVKEQTMGSASIEFDRTVVLASADAALRHRLCSSLSGLRWQVREARGGAEAMAQLEGQPTEALLLDHWLPDLEVAELAEQIHAMYPRMELLRMDGDPIAGGMRSPRRHELLHAVRQALGPSQGESVVAAASVAGKSFDAAAWPGSNASGPVAGVAGSDEDTLSAAMDERNRLAAALSLSPLRAAEPVEIPRRMPVSAVHTMMPIAIEGLVGQSDSMIELARVIRLVAPRKATVLIEGETGTGKEVVAHALHRLSTRAAKPFVVLNCAAIPEALLEAELFGHTRGAFTGAVQSRTGRIEAAHGGTLFLDEIGEMPIALQAKMLRFLESGELQRVGDNETVKVDVRVIAATHQQLEQRSAEGTFRLDLYHRLAVFPMDVPPLRERIDDMVLLCEHFLALIGKSSPRKMLSAAALDKLCTHDWPGNVRELAHVLERASILAEDSPSIRAEDIRMRRAVRT